MLIIFDVTPCSKEKYFSLWDKYNLIHLAKIQMLTFYARKGEVIIELIQKFKYLYLLSILFQS